MFSGCRGREQSNGGERARGYGEEPCEVRHRWADIIDSLTMYPETRRRVARILGELEAG
jgi:hypothetical protein